MRCVHVMVRGRVQGVGYRAWVEHEATVRGLAGWVRNRRDGTVEALFMGEDDLVDGMLDACKSGPPAAAVTAVNETDSTAQPGTGFAVMPTV